MLHTALYCLIMLVGLFTHLQATIFDNRYIPFLQRPYIIVPNRNSHVSFDAFFATASQAFGQNEQEIGIPQLSGIYNQSAIAKSFVTLGCENPLPSRYQDTQLIWDASGKLQAQGVECSLHQHIASDFYAGFYFYFMRVDTTSLFFLNVDASGLKNIPDSELLLLDRVRRQMNSCSGLITSDHATQFGVGDIDAYFMWERAWSYPYKFRSIRAQASIGGLIPSGQSRNIYEPTSVPFGGDGFWGAYISAQGEFELKEDWKAGVHARLMKRFGRTKEERIPLHCEPLPYAPLVSQADVNPGPTFVFFGWADFENIHKGLGARILLTIRRHWKDSWDISCNPACSCTNICNLEELTSWGSDYITLNVFYDFGKIKVCRGIDPIIFFAWDIPSNMLTTTNAIKTNKIVLGVEFAY